MSNAPLLGNAASIQDGGAAKEEDGTHERTGTVLGATFNLSNSILGGGISLLALPSAVQAAGPILFLVLLVVSGVATVTSAQLLADAAEIVGARSYDGLGEEVLGKWGKMAVVFFILLNNLGVCITFLCGFGDVIPEIIKSAAAKKGHQNNTNFYYEEEESLSAFGPTAPAPAPVVAAGWDGAVFAAAGNSTAHFYERRPVLIFLLILPLLPIMLSITRIEKLQSLSLAALVLDMLFVGFVVILFAEHGAENNPGPRQRYSRRLDRLTQSSTDGALNLDDATATIKGQYWTQGPSSAVGALNAIAIISLSFTCHFNIIPILIGLKEPKAITAVITWSTVANTILYAAVGLIAFFAHPTHLTGDILDDYAGFKGADFFQVCVVVAMVITFPLLGFEGQHAFQVLALGHGCTGGNGGSTGNEPAFLTPRRKHVIACTVYTLAAITVAAAVSNTSAMIALVGAACGIPIMYILPPLLYLRAASQVTRPAGTSGVGGIGGGGGGGGGGSGGGGGAIALYSVGLSKAERPWAKIGAFVLLVLGVLVCIACIISSILGF